MFSTDTPARWRALLARHQDTAGQGLASHAAIDAGDTALVDSLADAAIARPDARGSSGTSWPAHWLDAGACGEAITARASQGSVHAVEARERLRWSMLRDGPRADSGVLLSTEEPPHVTARSVYMVVPFLVITRDFAPADMQYRMHRQHLWDEATGAFEHRSDVAHASAPLGVALATSSGWVAAGLARALRNGGSEIPTEMRLRWQRDAAAVIAACARHTRDDGCLPRVLTDSSSAVNSAAGLMLCYAVFTGIADGWLDESQAATAHQWLETSLTHLDALGWVEPDVAPEAAEDDDNGALSPAFALMAICARDRLVHH